MKKKVETFIGYNNKPDMQRFFIGITGIKFFIIKKFLSLFNKDKTFFIVQEI